MENFQNMSSASPCKRTFTLHRRDRKQAIQTDSTCGGESPNSFPFVFCNPTQAYLNVDALKSYRTIRDGYLFTPLQLTPIMNATAQLEDLLLLINEVVETETGFIIQKTVQGYSKGWFPVTIDPCLTRSEQAEREELLKEKPTVPYVSFNDRYFFRADTPAAHPFIVIKGQNAVIRGNIPLDEEDKNMTFSELLKKAPKAFWNFKATIEQTENFLKSNIPLTQANYDLFFIQSQIQAKFYCLYTRTVPLIIKLCESTRRLLFDTLIKNHWKEIDASPQKARHTLKSDHTNIYRLAQRHKYIENADFLISLEKQRNRVAHPDPYVSGELFAAPQQIVNFFWSFLSNHAEPDRLSFYSRYNPIAMNTKVLDDLENDFHVLRSDAMCLQYARIKGKADPSADNKKVLASIKDDPIFMDDSNPVDNHQKRLGVAHGQIKKITSANIRENTIIRMQQAVLFPERELH